jgi:hypothetical protein
MKEQDPIGWRLIKRLSTLREETRTERNPAKLIKMLDELEELMHEAQKLLIGDEQANQESSSSDRDRLIEKSGASD